MDDTYCYDDVYQNSWAYQMSKFGYNQSGVKKGNESLC